MEPKNTSRISAWFQLMTPRDPHEEHRQASFLELFFDLCFIVSIAQAAAQLHHSIAEDHIISGIISFSMVFFAIWWAWMSFVSFLEIIGGCGAAHLCGNPTGIDGGSIDVLPIAIKSFRE